MTSLTLCCGIFVYLKLEKKQSSVLLSCKLCRAHAVTKPENQTNLFYHLNQWHLLENAELKLYNPKQEWVLRRRPRIQRTVKFHPAQLDSTSSSPWLYFCSSKDDVYFVVLVCFPRKLFKFAARIEKIVFLLFCLFVFIFHCWSFKKAIFKMSFRKERLWEFTYMRIYDRMSDFVPFSCNAWHFLFKIYLLFIQNSFITFNF